ncbi:Pol Polyprotein, partial [Phytophthora megakarya]
NVPIHDVSGFVARLLASRFIGPFTVAVRHGNAYTLELPSDMRLHPRFYVGRLSHTCGPSHLVVMTRRRRRAARPQLLLKPLHLLTEKANLFRHLNTDG